MVDKLTKEQRHRCMSAIKGKGTKPELLVRNHPRLPGHPDIVLRKYRTVVFVNGCFWHGHEGCKYYVLPKTNVEFWQKKIERNRDRDLEERQQLSSMGWHCITVWECQLKPKARQQTLKSLENMLYRIFLKNREIKRYDVGDEKNSMVAENAEDYEYYASNNH